MSEGPSTAGKGTGRKAVVLLSGGLDSATCLAVARSEGYEVYALSFHYGQRHRFELEAAAELARDWGAKEHKTISIGLDQVGGSALVGESAPAVPKDRDEAAMGAGVPITYVPARNTVFLALALGWAEVLGAFDLFIGVNAVDYSGYPDCRPEFIAAFEKLASLATKAGIEGNAFEIHAPLIRLSKAEIIQLGVKLGVDYGRTHSCYDPAPSGAACGRCDACQLRRKGFHEAGVSDPTRYA